MKPAAFRYHAPKTIEEAVETLAEVAGEDGRVLAGGQSLVPIMAFRLARPAHLVDINGVEALKRLVVEGGKLCIGACVRRAVRAGRGGSRRRTMRPSGGRQNSNDGSVSADGVGATFSPAGTCSRRGWPLVNTG